MADSTGYTIMGDHAPDVSESRGAPTKTPRSVATPGTNRDRSVSLEDAMKLPTRTWMLHGLIAAGELTIISGEPKAGKSALMLSISFQLACGIRTVHGHAATQQRVLYLALEGQADFRGRLRNFANRYGTAPGFRLWEGGVDFLDPVGRDATELIAEITKYEITVVVIDTVARAIAGGDENSSIGMGGFVRTIGRVLQETQVAIVALHHERKSGNGGAAEIRGHGSLRAAADTIARVGFGKNGVRTVTVLEGRSQPGARWAAFRIIEEVVEGDCGEEASTLMVDEAEWPAGSPTGRENVASSNDHQLSPKKPDASALAAIRRAVEQDGLVPGDDSGIPLSCRGAERVTVNANLAALWPDNSAETTRRRINRILKTLTEIGSIYQDPQRRVWLEQSSIAEQDSLHL